MNYYELHCHQLEEELDDWCQYQHFQNGTSCRTPVSWCRRCNVDTTHRWSQNDLSSVPIFQNYWERSTNSFCIERILLASYDGRNLSARLCPSGYRPLQFDHVRVEMHEIQDRSKSDRGSLWNASWCISFQIVGNVIFSLFWSFPISVAMRSSLLNHIVRNWEKVQCVLNDASIGFTFFQEMPAGAIDNALTPIQWAFFALRFRVCLEQFKQLYIAHVLKSFSWTSH